MNVTQQYFSRFAVLAALVVCIVNPAWEAQAARDSRITRAHPVSDPILSGPPAGPCAGRLYLPDYVAGTDAYGYRVAPADMPGNITAAIPSDTVIPEVRTHNKTVGHVDVLVDVPGLSAAASPVPPCHHTHGHAKP